MSKKNSKETLADQISGILTTTPAFFDPEDDGCDETNAKVTENDFESESDDEILLSKFRKQNIDILENVDIRYSGKKASRKNLRDSDEEFEGEDSSDDTNEHREFDGSNMLEYKDKEEKDSDEGDDEDSDQDDDEDDDTDGDDSNSEHSVEDNKFKHIDNTDIPKQLKKGLCVRNQLNIWENLLEMRIQLQKCLLTANKMPQTNIFMQMRNKYGEQFTSKVSETKKTVNNVLDKLIHLQALLLKQYPETKNLFTKKNQVEGSNSDEEIPSDTEDEKSSDDMTDDEIQSKKRKIDYEENISEQHKRYEEYRNSVIQKWNEKTRVVLAKHNPVHSVLNQISYSLNDKAKLIKRTQIKRSDYKILGQLNSEIEEDIQMQACNLEIFDDDDFYHQLLRELIEVKSADVTDPIQLGRQWIQLQNLRSKMKRKIDTKATKGRKVRYTVHSKLVNFMAPIDDCVYTDEAKTELYSSLFGKNHPVHTI